MMKDRRIDLYIAKSYPFAKPILKKLRLLIHKACPEVIETIKWSMPAFEFNGPMCSMAAFKAHCVFGFWKASLMIDPEYHLQPHKAEGGEAMGHFGRLTSVKEIPKDKVMIAFLKQAMKLNLDGVKLEKRKLPADKVIVIPEVLSKALSKNKSAKSVFNKFSPGNKKEYIQWITGAKTDATQQKRLSIALEWIGEGKKRNWKYEKPKSKPSV